MVKGKEKFALWITPECKQLVDDCYADDQCQSRSEYIEKAILGTSEQIALILCPLDILLFFALD